MNNEKEQKYAVIHIGGLDDCKFTISTLESAKIDCLLDVAEKFGPQYAHKGYYVVAVPSEKIDDAKSAIEKQLCEELNIEEISGSENESEKCPACGAEISEQHTECPDCGISFE